MNDFDEQQGFAPSFSLVSDQLAQLMLSADLLPQSEIGQEKQLGKVVRLK
ncbi:hypothetical protein [Leptolyngbya sp. FACHB-711]|nr:hypothetical protein [Leptolyngbya sp. FACHB-711]MBD2023696.1 hypothetical protein [Leptolyngbya sp. FACHB-711]